MALYVVTVPDPPAGFDFTMMVPGQYLWDVTGITAELTTTSVGPPTVAVDSSGNGNNGTYVGVNGAPFYPGLVPGTDLATGFGLSTVTDWCSYVAVPAAMVDWSTDFTFVALYENPEAFATQSRVFWAGDSGGIVPDIMWMVQDGPGGVMELQGATGFFQTFAGVVPHDGAPHLVAVTRTGNTVVFYVDGVAVPNQFNNFTPGAGALTDAGINGNGLYGGGGDSIVDEWACWNAVLAPADIAGLDAARGSFAAYSAAVLGLAPTGYYHLGDATSAGTGRQPSLIVSDGTHEVLAIPSGFPATALPGPYRYTWQPALNADQQSTDGTITTVAIPQLRIPAGYTVGVRTLDIQPGDQWSNIALWWDRAYMDAFDALNDYLFPGGIRLRYQQIGAPA